MSWQIPQQIEQDIIAGKAQYRTFQTGVGGQSILPVPNNAYAVIFGYDFSPAGGGFKSVNVGAAFGNVGAPFVLPNQDIVRFFETQQISFYTGQDYFPFIHHVDCRTTTSVAQIQNLIQPNSNTVLTLNYIEEIDTTPISRQVYITSSNDITITHGLILNTPVATVGTIPVTNRTPELLTYGGSGQNITAQSNFGPAVTPNQFMQPSPKDFQAFGLGLLPNGAVDQAWARPDLTNGLREASNLLQTIGNFFPNAEDSAAANYFLCLHYALYTSTIPEQRG